MKDDDDDRPDAASPRPTRASGGLTEWRLSRAERRLDTIEDEYPKHFASKDETSEIKRILFGCIALVATTISLIFASSFHLLFTK